MTEFDYIDSIDKITGNEIEIWASELDSEDKSPLTEEEFSMGLQLIHLEPKLADNEEAKQLINGGDYLATVLNKRLNAFHSFSMSIAAILFISSISKNPGCIVEYLNYLQYISHTQGHTNFTMNVLFQNIFPTGFFSEEILHKHWDAQKVRLTPDNLLDYPEAGKSIGCKWDS